MLFVSLAPAQSAPTISLSASTNNPPTGCDPGASQPGYTCNAAANVSWTVPPSEPGGAWTTTYLYQFTNGQVPQMASNRPICPHVGG